MTTAPDYQTDLARKRARPWDLIGIGALITSLAFGVLTVVLALILR